MPVEKANKTKAQSIEPDKVKKQERFDSDGLWKNLINRFFWAFLEMALPDLYKDADTSKQYKLLDKEFLDILVTADPEIHTSPHFADYLIEVPMKNGELELILFHIEIQSRGGKSIAFRMYHYKSLIFAHYKKEPVALAIITEGHVREARFYTHSHYGMESVYRYNNLVLADLDDEELRTSVNPFSLALYAAKCALKAKEEQQKYTYLRTLMEFLTKRGWSMEDKRDLALFIEWFIPLKDKALKEQYWEYRQQLSKEGKIVYVSFLKDIEEEKLKERMEEEIKKEMAKKLLARGISPDIIAESAEFSLDKVQALGN